MPRIKRFIYQDAALHIFCRGNNRQKIFADGQDKRYYCFLIRDLKTENEMIVYHYCIMDNHVHLIVWLSAKSRLSRFMKQLNLSYMNHFKRRYGYCGHLWQDRFKSNIIDADSYLLQCGKYIELNPVRAGVVDHAEAYEYSSYRHYAKGIEDSILDDNPVYLGLSPFGEIRERLYRDFVVDEQAIRDSLIRQSFIGSQAFIQKIRDYYGIVSRRRKRGRPKKTEK